MRPSKITGCNQDSGTEYTYTSDAGGLNPDPTATGVACTGIATAVWG